VDVLLLLGAILLFVLWHRGPAMLPKLGQAFGRGVKEAKEEIGGALKDRPSESDEQPRS
jgi:Sec-independent protein translocase protein TatA